MDSFLYTLDRDVCTVCRDSSTIGIPKNKGVVWAVAQWKSSMAEWSPQNRSSPMPGPLPLLHLLDFLENSLPPLSQSRITEFSFL